MSIISAGTSNTSTLVYTGDTTGAMVFQTNGTTEAMRITNGQQVGIGTNNPGGKLDVIGTSLFRGTVGGRTLKIAEGGVTTIGFDIEADTNAGDLTLSSAVSNGLIAFKVAGSERMRIDSAGRILTPFRPAFHAVSTSIKEITGSPFVFDSTYFNIGNHYNTSNGRFTAPVAGVYSLVMEYLTDNGNASNIDLRFYKNGTQSQIATTLLSNFSGGYYRKGYLIGLTSLNANDYITVQTQSGGSNGNLYGDNNESGGKGHTAFKGFLVG